MQERGATEEDVVEAVCSGHPEPAQRGLVLYGVNKEFQR
jgi:hypothetical protein